MVVQQGFRTFFSGVAIPEPRRFLQRTVVMVGNANELPRALGIMDVGVQLPAATATGNRNAKRFSVSSMLHNDEPPLGS